MADGLAFVIAAYAVAAAVLALWFAMIVRRLRSTRDELARATATGREGAGDA